MRGVIRAGRGCAAVFGLVAATASAAAAQVSATFYHIPTSPGAPDYASSFASSPYCSTNIFGGPTGFSVDFNDDATRTAISALCPLTTADDFWHNFAVRFTGSITTSTSGTYSAFVNTDDGNIFSVNNVTYYNGWVAQGSGPGTVNGIVLNAGQNPFVLDYFENSYGGAYATLQLGDGLVAESTTAPEPASVGLLATGLVGVFGAVRRRVKTNLVDTF